MKVSDAEARFLLRTNRVQLTKQLIELKAQMRAVQEAIACTERQLDDIRHAEGLLDG